MNQILSEELRDRAQAVSNRLQSEIQSKKDKEAQEREQLEQAALQDFWKALSRDISEEFMQRLKVKVKTKAAFGNNSWQIQEGPYKGRWSQSVIFAQIKLSHECSIEIHPWGTRWKLSIPKLSENKKRWVNSEIYDCLDPQKTTLEEFILLALLDFEEEEQKYLKALEQEALNATKREEENKRRRQEDTEYRAKVEAEDAEIEELINQAIAPYNPRWPENYTLRVFKWRYCTAAADGEFDYQEIYSLSPHMHHDEVFQKPFVITIEGNRIALDMEAHKPVVSEIVCSSLQEAKAKFSYGFYERAYEISLIGVSKEKLLAWMRYGLHDSSYYWQWSESEEEKTNKRFWGDTFDLDGIQMKPWMRELLGLPKLPRAIHINKPQ